MTLTQRKKLAKAARELASEYAEGRGPELSNQDFCGCVLGQLLYGGDRDRWRKDVPSTALDIDIETDGILSEATGHELGHVTEEPVLGAVVFPLLWLADELESAS